MIAGELSGDKLGASLIEGLRYETDQKIIFSGIGGPLMEAAGLKSLFIACFCLEIVTPNSLTQTTAVKRV